MNRIIPTDVGNIPSHAETNITHKKFKGNFYISNRLGDYMKILTGVISFNSIDPECLYNLMDNGIDLEWEVAIKDKSEEEIEDLADSWESQDSTYLIGFKLNSEGKYEENKEKPFSAIISVGNVVIQITRSTHMVTDAHICSPCYPNQADLDSEGSLSGYIFPPEYLADSYDITRIKEVTDE